MSSPVPPNADDVRRIVEERLAALDGSGGIQETVTVEWRGHQRSLPVISMPVELLAYNPATHRVRAQRSLDPARDRDLDTDPFGPAGQAYLHHLLMGDPADPSKIDPSFEALKDDLQEHGQSDPGIITRAGVLINGNTRRAALKVLGQEHIRVGVLPPDAGHDDMQSIELSLQLRKDHRRDYSFMNFLLAVDERVAAGRPASEIQADFRMKATTFERSRWILSFIREAIERSAAPDASGGHVSMRLVDFESDQGKLEELYRAYSALKAKSPDEAEALREQRLLAIALGKSKTDVRLIEADFTERYMKRVLPEAPPTAAGVKIPGTSIVAPAASQKVEALRALTNEVLKARAVELAPGAVSAESLSKATTSLGDLKSALDGALVQAGKQGRIIKKKFAAADRLSDANEDLELAQAAIADARATGNFDPEDLDEALVALRSNLGKLAVLVARGSGSEAEGSDGVGEGLAWLRAAASVGTGDAS
jgi:ParB-like chromosome segregation protein Spo0J